MKQFILAILLLIAGAMVILILLDTYSNYVIYLDSLPPARQRGDKFL